MHHRHNFWGLNLSEWIQRLEGHPVSAEAKSFDALLSEVEDVAAKNPQAISQLSRLQQINRLLMQRLQSVDPVLVPLAVLNNLHSHVQHQRNEVNQYRANQNVGHLSNANSQADGVLTHLGTMIYPAAPSDIEGVRDAVASFRKSAGQYLRYIEDEHSSLKTQMNGLSGQLQQATAEVSSQKSRLDTAISQFQQQFSQAEDTRREQFTQGERAREEKFVAAMKEKDEEFRSGEEERSGEFAGALDERRNAFDQFLKKSRDDTDEQRVKLEEVASSLLDHLSDSKSRAEGLVHVIANTGMVGGYQRVANEERLAARLWEGLAVISMAGLVGFAVYAFFGTLNDDFKWGVFLARAFVAITFGILAGYAARQAEKHHQVERRNRRVELELASIGPFLAELPEEERNDVKKRLAARLFGNTDGTGSGGRQVDPSDELVKSLLAVAEQAAKK